MDKNIQRAISKNMTMRPMFDPFITKKQNLLLLLVK